MYGIYEVQNIIKPCIFY